MGINKVIKIVAICVFVLFCISTAIRFYLLKSNLENNRKLTTGQVYKFRPVGSKYPGGTANFRYLVDDSIYDGSTSFKSINKKLGYKLVDSLFYVLYDSNRPTNAVILIDKGDFEYYDISYPDSLKWLDEIFNK